MDCCPQLGDNGSVPIDRGCSRCTVYVPGMVLFRRPGPQPRAPRCLRGLTCSSRIERDEPQLGRVPHEGQDPPAFLRSREFPVLARRSPRPTSKSYPPHCFSSSSCVEVEELPLGHPVQQPALVPKPTLHPDRQCPRRLPKKEGINQGGQE